MNHTSVHPNGLPKNIGCFLVSTSSELKTVMPSGLDGARVTLLPPLIIL